MHRPNRLVAVGYALTQGFDEIAVQLRNGIAYGVGHIDGSGPLVNHRLNHTAQKVHFAAVAVFGAEFNIATQVATKTHRLFGLLQHLLGAHAQLFLHVQRRGGNKGVDAAPIGPLERLGCAGNITVIGARERADGGVFDGVGNHLHGFKIAVGAGGKTGLNHIHLEALQLAGNAQFFVFGHGSTGRLLAIAQGGIKNDQLIGHRFLLVSEMAKKKPAAVAYGLLRKKCARAYCLRPREVSSRAWANIFMVLNVAQLRDICRTYWCRPRSSGSSVEVLMTLVCKPLALRQA